jgi:diguanylate cyclase (GGDEF)-like protein
MWRMNEVEQQVFDFISSYTDVSQTGIFIIDIETFDVLFCNNYFAEVHSTTTEKVIGTKCYSYFGYTEQCPFCPKQELIDNLNTDKKSFRWETKIDACDKWLHLHNRILRWIDGRLVMVSSCYDITEKRALQDQLSYMAFYDQRLKIPNGNSLAEHMSSISSEDSFLICFNIHDLRKINEAYSREAGDELLKEIKVWIEGLPGYNSNLYRVNGDEFVLLMQDSSEEEVIKTAERIWERFIHHWELKIGSMNISLFASLSLGIIPCIKDFNDYSILLGIIERVIDMAKKDDGILLYNNAISEKFYLQLRMELSLKHSVLNNMQGFSVYFQPIADPNTGTWAAIESLCRWESPEFGSVLPLDFIPIAEANGFISKIDLWVLEKSIEQVKLWKLDKLSHFVLGANISPANLGNPNLYSKVINLLEKYNFPPNKLTLEITESKEINFNDRILSLLERLKSTGIAFALDDFGTGYASFSKLNMLPIDIIKLDQSFIENIEHDYYIKNVIRVMIEFAHAAGFKVVAEGIENINQMQILLDYQVDFFQGFLFSKPLSKTDVEHNLHKFSNSVNVLPVKTINTIDIHTINMPGGGYSLPVDLSRLVNHCLFLLNGELNIIDATNQVLKLIGEQLKLSRIYVVLLPGGSSREIHQWYDPQIASHLRLSENDVDNFVPSDIWSELLENNGFILVSDTTRLPEELKSDMEKLHVNAMVEFPIWDHKKQIGVFGADECVKKLRHWTAEEVQFLYHICVLFAGVIKRYFLDQENQTQNSILNIMIDQIADTE